MATARMELGASGRAVAANVKRLRKAHGWSLRVLAQELASVGHGLSPDALNKIENGANPDAKHVRRVDIDDLMALAIVLGVSPSALLLPLTVDGAFEVTGGGEVDAAVAWEWADGKRPLRRDGSSERTAMLEYLLWSRPSGLEAESDG